MTNHFMEYKTLVVRCRVGISPDQLNIESLMYAVGQLVGLRFHPFFRSSGGSLHQFTLSLAWMLSIGNRCVDLILNNVRGKDMVLSLCSSHLYWSGLVIIEHEQMRKIL